MPLAYYKCACGKKVEVRYAGRCKEPPKVYCIDRTKVRMQLTGCVPSGDTKIKKEDGR